MAVKKLTWQQVNAWRLDQHGLAPRFPPKGVIQAAVRTGGIQAQVMSAAEQALGVRVEGLLAPDVPSALWQERTLVKTWAMRSALHLVAASELPLYIAARDPDDSRNWVGYFKYYGIERAQYQAYLEAAPEILSDQPMTREQLAQALAKRLKAPELRDLMVSKGWGTPLKPLAWRGDLCFGPSQGRSVTFVNPRRWLGEWQAVEPHEAQREIARRYFRAYGPARVEEYAHWWGQTLTSARKIVRSLAHELEPVEVEGWPALALRETLEPMVRSAPPEAVRLLPLFDAYVLGIGRGSDIEPLLPQAYQRQVYRPQGWISAVVLVNGYLKGVWEAHTRRGQVMLELRLFEPAAPAVRAGIEAEAERLGRFMGLPVVTTYAR